MPPKRQSATNTGTKRPRKKQKTAASEQIWEDAETTLNSFSESFCKLKAEFEAKKANEEEELKELRERLRDRETDVANLVSELKATRLEVNKEVVKRESVEATLQRASDAKDIDEKTFNYRLSAKDKMMSRLHDEIKDLKRQRDQAQHAHQYLSQRLKKDEMQNKRNQQLIDAASEVKAIFADMPVQKMGQVGETLQKMETALDQLKKTGNGER